MPNSTKSSVMLNGHQRELLEVVQIADPTGRVTNGDRQ
jgi:hypothetical protein